MSHTTTASKPSSHSNPHAQGDACCSSNAKAQTECCSTTASANPLDTHGAICHVEFTVPNLQQAKDFYGPLFQWQFMPFQEKEWYFFRAPSTPCGCVIEGAPHTDDKTTLYVNVSDINSTLSQAAKLGAKMTQPKTEIPGGHGYFAKFRAPEGNVIGLYSH